MFVAVQQWQRLIAVNYAARAQGVLRHDSAAEAVKKCKEIRLIHVATYAEGESEGRYHSNPTPKSHKVSLESYRREVQNFSCFLCPLSSLDTLPSSSLL